MKKFFSDCAETTKKIGAEYAATLEKGDVVLLIGEMGAGKTAFTQGIAAGLGVTAKVTSPTYAYMNDYGGLYHFDCYRLSSGEDAEGLGLTDYFYADGICVIEWPENIADVLPRAARKVTIIKTGENTREIIAEDIN
ncbi:MAG: tRNA (adenosine(37)-N6)-threonylcarbamoyltransferase complex ATPase subunit type 1 TsaE [Clostridia bacterium]|nr:tRNA (adenosine(37)-N6)-threonylcarbamoyltransferase complex ATPase subunit type 1 TsaE [Clostridia bacterium]